MAHLARIFKSFTTFPQFNLIRTLSKDVGFIKPSVNQDLLLQNLKNATNASGVLDMVSAHHNIMNSKHLMQALRSLFTLQKYESSSKETLSTNDIINHPDFHILCKRLKTHSRAIELNEIIEALKVISYVGVSPQSTIVQVLLQLIRHNVNQLSLHHIIFLEFLLKQFEKSPLVEALLIALPMVFEINLTMKMDRDNISQIADYLHYVSNKNMSAECIQLLINCLIDKSDYLTPKIAVSVIRSLCSLKTDDGATILLKITLHYLTKNVDKVRHNDLDIITTQLSRKIANGNFNYYSENFFNACIDRIVDEGKGYEVVLWYLRKVAKIGHFNPKLIDYISELCKNNPSLVSDAKPTRLSILVIGLSANDYKPTHWDCLRQAIIDNDVTNCNARDLFWVSHVLALAQLDIYIPKVLEKLFNLDFLENILQQKFIRDEENILLLYQAISALKPEHSHYLPPDWFMHKIIKNVRHDIDFPLEGALEKAMGGRNYIRTNMNTKMGHCIDHVVIMRKGGYPVAFNSENMSTIIEELQVPTDSQIVLILALNSDNYSINCERITGKTALRLRTLENSGFIVVPICVNSWSKLADYEKIPYLMQAIREKSENTLQASVIS